jgi:hypothetical protein
LTTLTTIIFLKMTSLRLQISHLLMMLTCQWKIWLHNLKKKKSKIGCFKLTWTKKLIVLSQLEIAKSVVLKFMMLLFLAISARTKVKSAYWQDFQLTVQTERNARLAVNGDLKNIGHCTQTVLQTALGVIILQTDYDSITI